MQTEAQKRANARYAKRNISQKLLKFYPKDRDLFDWVSVQPKQNAYVLGLIRADMERRQAVGSTDNVVAFKARLGEL